MKMKVAIITGTRAEYGLLYPLIRQMKDDSSFDIHLIATGTHLSQEHGLTIKYIEEDKLTIAYKVDILRKKDKEEDICISISKGMSEFSSIFANERYDYIIILGDRYELWAIAIPAVIHKIPIVHIHGGELTKGLIDDAVRHSITKMASIHFVSIKSYANRVIQMGEHPERVYTVGAIGIDNIVSTKLMTKQELGEVIGIDFNEKIALLTYHPVTLDCYKEGEKQILEIIQALMETELKVIVTMPNSDSGGQAIYDVLRKYSHMYPNKFIIIKNLGQRVYLSAMEYVKIMIGNSSSGIIESSSFKLPVVNIGDRQDGRFKPKNVIDCLCEKQEILSAVNTALSTEFLDSISNMSNIYGRGNTAKKIISILKKIDFSNKERLLKKGFYDINYWR